MEEKEILIWHFCKHLVGLSIRYRLKKNPEYQYYDCIGTILLYEENVFMMIAGHAANEIKILTNSSDHEVISANICDSFSGSAVSNLALPATEVLSEIVGYDQSGADIGFVRLETWQVRILEKNGISAITPHSFKSRKLEELSDLFLLGVPIESIVHNGDEIEWGPTLIRLLSPEISELEGDIWQHLKLKGSFPRYEMTLPPGRTIKSLKGMSGGPVFAFNKDHTRYFIIGIQSSWDRKDKVFVTPTFVVGELLSGQE